MSTAFTIAQENRLEALDSGVTTTNNSMMIDDGDRPWLCTSLQRHAADNGRHRSIGLSSSRHSDLGGRAHGMLLAAVAHGVSSTLLACCLQARRGCRPASSAPHIPKLDKSWRGAVPVVAGVPSMAGVLPATTTTY
eukprot:scpid78452/ scgid9939/ 